MIKCELPPLNQKGSVRRRKEEVIHPNKIHLVVVGEIVTAEVAARLVEYAAHMQITIER
ncbi:hypothetical protein SAMN05216323_105816 [Williamwhitmania taraxaci]|uniref:Uncharacterized protein n=1 Tax=Williamwhitmania taraxaci TaxID=1640674 RepID=A0A1G6Q8L2_9BACT|nr:hypothetical protein SAMN05216323_105816 [Williamwhitmania taraxaci]